VGYNLQQAMVRAVWKRAVALKILVVDDSADYTDMLQTILVQEGYEVELAHDGAGGLSKAAEAPPDLVLLDIMMPGLDGLNMLSRLREFSNVPVIFLTVLGDEETRARGLDAGAEDFVSKPFDIADLKARIRAVLRRAASPAPASSRPLSFYSGALVIDPVSRQVSAHGQVVDLAPIEFKLLLYLAYHAGQVVTSRQILYGVWGPGYENSPAVVKVYIRRLRAKIESNPREPRAILTRRGVGYTLAADEHTAQAESE
jgi:DNA-binding response OmpR family regulator